jgi:hypothetical protein
MRDTGKNPQQRSKVGHRLNENASEGKEPEKERNGAEKRI